MKNHQKVVSVIEVGFFVAIAVVLDLVFGFFFEMPFGGSIGIAMLPIFIVSFRRGWKNGLLAGAAYGLIQTMIKVYFLSLSQYVLEYLVAFMVIGMAGVFKNTLKKPAPLIGGIVLGSLLRYVVASIVGVIFWRDYIGEEVEFMDAFFHIDTASVFTTENAFFTVGSFMYNALYMIPSMILCILVALVLQKRQILSLNLIETAEKTEKM